MSPASGSSAGSLILYLLLPYNCNKSKFVYTIESLTFNSLPREIGFMLTAAKSSNSQPFEKVTLQFDFYE